MNDRSIAAHVRGVCDGPTTDDVGAVLRRIGVRQVIIMLAFTFVDFRYVASHIR